MNMPLKPTKRITFLALSASLLFSAGSCVKATEQASDPISATNLHTLHENLGKQVTVRGRVASTGESRSGHQFLNFADTELTAVCYPEHVTNFPDGKPSVRFREKTVELQGKVELYKHKLQIRLRDPSQIRIITDASPEARKGIPLKQIGRETWLSPAGLRYQGRDPAGLTRVEHVQRHIKDAPSRAGPHGVFDGGSAVAFAVIDAAWMTAQKRQLRPRREGDRSSYTVPMGRRIGYLGGRLGAARGNPPLTRVFIVFTTGTKDIITAFPK